MLSQGYLIDPQLCIAVLWLLYVTLLHRRIPMGAARVYLLTALPVAMLLPLLRIPLLPAPELLPTEGLTYVLIEATPTTETPSTMTVGQILGWIYAAGVLVFGIIAGIGIVKTWIGIRRAEAEMISGSRVVFSGDVGGAYSVFGTIFVSDKYQGSPLLGQILAHEQSHLRYHHTADLVWIGLWRAALWFNPVSWHFPRLLRQVHEFQADRAVIRQGNPVGPDIELLINAEAGIYPGAADILCYSLTQKRLTMIFKSMHWETLPFVYLSVPRRESRSAGGKSTCEVSIPN